MKTCPIMANRHYSTANCQKEECAWWDQDYERCCMISIAKNLDSITEVCEGQRTVFVRSV